MYLVNLLDEGGVVLVLACLDHGADGVEHAHAVPLQVRVGLHVRKVLPLNLGVRLKEAEENAFSLNIWMTKHSQLF